MATNEPSDQMLRRVAYSIARMYMEVERGLRPPEHLEPILTKAAYQRYRRNQYVQRFPQSGPVIPTDIRGITIDRHLPGQATISMTTREEADRWGAIVLHLRAPKGPGDSWKADQLERLVRRRELAKEREQAQPVTLAQRIQRVQQERDLAEAAGKAIAARLKDLKSVVPELRDEAQLKSFRQQRRRWSATVRDLDDEILDLRRRQVLRERFGLTAGRDGNGVELSDTELTRVLGPKPPDEKRGQLWQLAADDIQDYRERWEVSDAEVALGSPPDDVEQRRHRERVAELLRTVAPQLRCTSQERERQGVARDQGVAVEL